MKLSGNTILITGGTAGIGFEIAKEFLARDNKVIVTGRNPEKIASMQQELPDVTVLQNDVANSNEIDQLFDIISDTHPNINLLINNAGVMRKINLHSYTISLREQLRGTTVKVFELMPPGTNTELMDTFKNELETTHLMSTQAMVQRFMKGLAKNELEIRPGISNQVKFFNRLFPNYVQKQFSKTVSSLEQR